MSVSPHPRSYNRAGPRELEERLAFLAIAMNDGLPHGQAVRLAMECFQVSRRMAQLYVKRIQERTGPMEFVMRMLTRMLRCQGAPNGAPLARVAPDCASAIARPL